MPDENPSLIILCPRCYRRATVQQRDGRLFYAHSIAEIDTNSDVTTPLFVYCPFEQLPPPPKPDVTQPAIPQPGFSTTFLSRVIGVLTRRRFDALKLSS
jgi:hypothetical protein